MYINLFGVIIALMCMNKNKLMNWFIYRFQVRTVGLAIICFIDNIWQFLCLKFYPIFLEQINLHGCLLIYGVGCIVGFVFVLWFLKETSGQSLDEVGIDEKTKTENV